MTGRLQTRLWGICLGLLLAAGPACAADATPSLWQSYDPSMQRLLDQALNTANLRDAGRRGKLAVALVDVTNLQRPRVAQINGDHMMYAASLPKIGILLAAFVQIEHGKMLLTRKLRTMLTDMIRFSSNEAATSVMNLVGKRRVNEILSSAPYRFYDARTNGGLWVGKEYGKNPAFERDPLHNISHGATAMQVARFYYMLEAGTLLPPDLTAQMKDALSRPGIHHKFIKGLGNREATVYRKSGTWHEWHADSMLVETPRARYILVALAEDPRGGDWMVRLAPAVHDLLVPPMVALNSPGDDARAAPGDKSTF